MKCSVLLVSLGFAACNPPPATTPAPPVLPTPEIPALPDGSVTGWKKVPIASKTNFAGVTTGLGRIVAVGTAGEPAFYTSTDGATFGSTVMKDTSDILTGVTFAPDVGFVAVGSSVAGDGPSSLVLTSKDGVAWTPQPVHDAGYLFGVTPVGATLLAFGQELLLTSTDGAAWTSRTPDLGETFNLYYSAAAASPTTTVVVGSYKRPFVALTTADPTSDEAWMGTDDDDEGNEFSAITYSATFGRFLAMGFGPLVTSTDGVHFTSGASGDTAVTAVVECNGTWIAVGSRGDYPYLEGVVLTSTAAEPLSPSDWTQEATVGEEVLRGVSCGLTTPIAVGDQGIVITRS